MRLHPLRRAVLAPQQREHVVDLLAVLLRLGPRQVQQLLLEGHPRMAQQMGEGERVGDPQPVRGVPVHDRGAGRLRARTVGRPAGPARRAAQPQVDAPGVQRVDQAELLYGRQRRAVPELHRAGAEPDGRGSGGGQREHDGRGGPGHPGIEVVLGEPVAGVAELLGPPGEIDAVPQGLGGGGTGRDGDEVEDPEGDAGHVRAP